MKLIAMGGVDGAIGGMARIQMGQDVRAIFREEGVRMEPCSVMYGSRG